MFFCLQIRDLLAKFLRILNGQEFGGFFYGKPFVAEMLRRYGEHRVFGHAAFVHA